VEIARQKVKRECRGKEKNPGREDRSFKTPAVLSQEDHLEDEKKHERFQNADKKGWKRKTERG